MRLQIFLRKLKKIHQPLHEYFSTAYPSIDANFICKSASIHIDNDYSRMTRRKNKSLYPMHVDILTGPMTNRIFSPHHNVKF